MSEKPYVFISYAHRDSEVVLSCVNAMKKSGITIWYDEGIEAGSEWPEYIADKVVNCAKFVLFISKAYLESQNCKRELNFAISRKKDILSIFIEDVELSPGMEMQLGTYQSLYAKRFGGLQDFQASLCREAYFNPCREGGTPSAPVQPAASAAPAAQPARSYSAVSPAQPVRSATPPTRPVQQTPVRPVQQTPARPAQPINRNFSTGANGQSTFNVSSSSRSLPTKNRLLAGLLALLGGSLGLQRFYLGKPLLGVLCLIFCFSYIPAIIGVIEGFMILSMSDAKFCEKYNCKV